MIGKVGHWTAEHALLIYPKGLLALLTCQLLVFITHTILLNIGTVVMEIDWLFVPREAACHIEVAHTAATLRLCNVLCRDDRFVPAVHYIAKLGHLDTIGLLSFPHCFILW